MLARATVHRYCSGFSAAIKHNRHISYVLGIETSCDDTAVAVVDSEGRVLSEVVSSQWEMINKWKGIVPALAARAHEENLPLVLSEAMRLSGLEGFKSLSAIAVTAGPGLAPCLNVGLSAAIEIATKNELDFVAVNHLEAHALVPRLLQRDLNFPFLVLLVSGGHCTLVLAKDIGQYDVLGNTVDDSIGEAFDKVARMLSLTEENSTSHGGKLVEMYAELGNSRAFPFTEPMKKKQRKDCDFSYSGLKTAMVRYVNQHKPLDKETKQDLAASFQRTAISHLVTRTKRACEISKSTANIQHLVVCGGVAANAQVRKELQQVAEAEGLTPVFPPVRYCTDNGVMVAWAGMERYLRGVRDNPNGMKYTPRWPLNQLRALNN
ncbi:Aste57867_20312 [Aphanomyces stellatus]|uniref:N(6)-L-threonylcarbamoyladenine synthase n=1 Tax=Aphanomyces stellatus TaxID=120398 RepID=A0A485LG81_9STRA|nr:hypothetical protein As57867_020246 [Aphanomyces stellatus]KAF0701525.1 hypothetical protein As57867_007992 [Aphanomyces stellatus]VFT84915.1 Aste57867_8022 [Aphanomyces stellatus]VFT97001.1 Aste57867_20312 [Aphanomyces stellatus]